MPRVKITDEQVRSIRRAYDGTNHRPLAGQYQMSVSHIMNLVYYRLRANAGPPKETMTYYISDGKRE